jgi:hypothetical protein
LQHRSSDALNVSSTAEVTELDIISSFMHVSRTD